MTIYNEEPWHEFPRRIEEGSLTTRACSFIGIAMGGVAGRLMKWFRVGNIPWERPAVLQSAQLLFHGAYPILGYLLANTPIPVLLGNPLAVYMVAAKGIISISFFWRAQSAKALVPFTSSRYIYGALPHHLPIGNLTPNPYSKFFPVGYPNQFIGIRAQGLQETMVAIELRPLT